MSGRAVDVVASDPRIPTTRDSMLSISDGVELDDREIEISPHLIAGEDVKGSRARVSSSRRNSSTCSGLL